MTRLDSSILIQLTYGRHSKVAAPLSRLRRLRAQEARPVFRTALNANSHFGSPQRGLVETAVGRGIGRVLQNRRHHLLLPSGVAPARELGEAFGLVVVGDTGLV